MKKFLFTACLAGRLWAAALVPAAASAEIKLGILPRLGPVEMFMMFNPLAEHLTKETGEKVSIVIPRDFETFKAAVKRGEFDLCFSNPLVYIQLKKDQPLEPLAVAVEPKAGARFRGVIITRKESGINRVQDLKGKKLVFVDRNSAGGYLFPMLLLHKAGFDINKDFTVLPFVQRHDNVTLAVFNKAADAGAIREDDLEKMIKKVDLSQIKVVAYTEYFPNWPVFAAQSLGKDRAAKIRSALLRLRPGDPVSRKVLSPGGLIGFEPVSDADYEQLRGAARLVGGL